MKKIFTLILFGIMAACSLCLNVACNSTSPSAPNFQSPLQTIAAINPTATWTPTSTNTPTPTITATPIPYFASAWPGFNQPQAIAAYNNPINGGIFIADTGNNFVEKYNFNGTLVSNWGDGGKGKGKIAVNQPFGVAVDGSGNLYVVGGTSGVNKYDSFGNLTAQFTSVAFSTPRGVAVDGSGNIYVSDNANKRIVQLNSSGAQGSGFGGTGAVTLSAPVTALYGVAVDATNSFIYVATLGTSAYNALYGFTLSSGSPVTTITGFVYPNGLTFDASNKLYVTDLSPARIDEFLAGNFISADMTYGSSYLNNPTGVAVDSNGNVYVADWAGNQVVKFLP